MAQKQSKQSSKAKPFEAVQSNIRRIDRGGEVSFQVRYKPRGKESICEVFDTLLQAQQCLLAAKTAGIRPVPKETVGTAIDEYRQHLKKIQRYTPFEATYTNLLELFFTTMGDERTLENVDRGVVETLLITLPDTIKRGYEDEAEDGPTYTPSTVRKVYFQLKKVMRWHAEKHNWVMSASLFPQRDKLLPSAWDEDQARDRRLEPGEEFRLYMAARRSKNGREWIRVIALALETALRAQEILFAEWKEISTDTRIWRVPKKNSKTGKARQVPLTKRAIRLLLEQKPKDAKPTDRVFNTWKDTRTMGLTFQRICERAGVKGFRFHDLRHTAITRLVAENHSPALIMKTTGHTKYMTFERYVNLNDTELVGTIAAARDAKRQKQAYRV